MYVSTNPRRGLQSLDPQIFNFACWKYWRKESKKSKFPHSAVRRDTSGLKYEQWGMCADKCPLFTGVLSFVTAAEGSDGSHIGFVPGDQRPVAGSH